jgi:hypothetical protein
MDGIHLPHPLKVLGQNKDSHEEGEPTLGDDSHRNRRPIVSVTTTSENVPNLANFQSSIPASLQRSLISNTILRSLTVNSFSGPSQSFQKFKDLPSLSNEPVQTTKTPALPATKSSPGQEPSLPTFTEFRLPVNAPLPPQPSWADKKPHEMTFKERIDYYNSLEKQADARPVELVKGPQPKELPWEPKVKDWKPSIKLEPNPLDPERLKLGDEIPESQGGLLPESKLEKVRESTNIEVPKSSSSKIEGPEVKDILEETSIPNAQADTLPVEQVSEQLANTDVKPAIELPANNEALPFPVEIDPLDLSPLIPPPGSSALIAPADAAPPPVLPLVEAPNLIPPVPVQETSGFAPIIPPIPAEQISAPPMLASIPDESIITFGRQTSESPKSVLKSGLSNTETLSAYFENLENIHDSGRKDALNNFDARRLRPPKSQLPKPQTPSLLPHPRFPIFPPKIEPDPATISETETLLEGIPQPPKPKGVEPHRTLPEAPIRPSVQEPGEGITGNPVQAPVEDSAEVSPENLIVGDTQARPIKAGAAIAPTTSNTEVVPQNAKLKLPLIAGGVLGGLALTGGLTGGLLGGMSHHNHSGTTGVVVISNETVKNGEMPPVSGDVSPDDAVTINVAQYENSTQLGNSSRPNDKIHPWLKYSTEDLWSRLVRINKSNTTQTMTLAELYDWWKADRDLPSYLDVLPISTIVTPILVNLNVSSNITILNNTSGPSLLPTSRNKNITILRLKASSPDMNYSPLFSNTSILVDKINGSRPTTPSPVYLDVTNLTVNGIISQPSQLPGVKLAPANASAAFQNHIKNHTRSNPSMAVFPTKDSDAANIPIFANTILFNTTILSSSTQINPAPTSLKVPLENGSTSLMDDPNYTLDSGPIHQHTLSGILVETTIETHISETNAIRRSSEMFTVTAITGGINVGYQRLETNTTSRDRKSISMASSTATIPSTSNSSINPSRIMPEPIRTFITSTRTLQRGGTSTKTSTSTLAETSQNGSSSRSSRSSSSSNSKDTAKTSPSTEARSSRSSSSSIQSPEVKTEHNAPSSPPTSADIAKAQVPAFNHISWSNEIGHIGAGATVSIGGDVEQENSWSSGWWARLRRLV